MSKPTSSRHDLRFRGYGVLHEGALYVERAADRQLVRNLAAGKHCHVLAPRQMGKTNLRIRAAQRLREMKTPRGEAIRCAGIDLTQIGGVASSEQLFFGLGHRIIRDLDVTFDMPSYWAKASNLSPGQRFYEVVRAALGSMQDAAVIFLDEIAVALRLEVPGLNDELFDVIASLLTGGGDDHEIERLTLCLMGTVPSLDLLDELQRTPFRKTHRVELEDFTRAEMAAFRDALRPDRGDPDKLVDALFDWTRGHPAMLQQLCERLTSASFDGDEGEEDEATLVRDLVASTFFTRTPGEIPVLSEIQDWLSVRGPSRPDALGLLRAYRQVLRGEKIPASQGAVEGLRMLGLVSIRREHGTAEVRPRNPILSTVFDLPWVEEQLRTRFYFADPLTSWLAHDRSEDYLLNARQLEEALAWAREREDLPEEERELLEASREALRRKREAEERDERERETERRQLESHLAAEKMRYEDERARREREKRKYRGLLAAFFFVAALVVLPGMLIGYPRLLNRSVEDLKTKADIELLNAAREADDARTAVLKAKKDVEEATSAWERAQQMQGPELSRKRAAEARRIEALGRRRAAEKALCVKRLRADRANALVPDTRFLIAQLFGSLADLGDRAADLHQCEEQADKERPVRERGDPSELQSHGTVTSSPPR
jgi:hypothetical protein